MKLLKKIASHSRYSLVCFVWVINILVRLLPFNVQVAAAL
jgi:hypothetical protein